MISENANTLHLNKPQMKSLLIDAKDEVDIWGRGTGKSEKRQAYRAHACFTGMPRCGIAIMGASYMQLLDRTLPPIVKEWEEWGKRRNVDYWIRRYPPKQYKLPHWCPETPDHSIFYRVGDSVSVGHLIGQDRVGTSNSKSIDGIIGDEAKLLNFDRLENETFQANRGNKKYFGEHHLHHGICFTTDMPTDKTILDRLLVFDKEHKKEENLERIQLILSCQTQIYLEKQKKNPSLSKILKYEAYINDLRRYTTWFSEASTLMNAEVLGMEFIRKLKRILPDYVFKTSILNIRPNTVEHGFYPDLRDSHFTYSNDYSFIDSYDTHEDRPNDCRKDADILKNEPLIIGNDWGGRINVLVVGQKQLNNVRVSNALYVRHPDTLPELAKVFHNYYRFLPHRDVVIPYDHTATGTYPNSKLSLIDSFSDELIELGWHPVRVDIGKTPEPNQRFQLSTYALRGDHPDFMSVSFNAENCQYLKTSMQLCEIDETGNRGFRKKKDKEKDKEFDQREAPHFSDAYDTLLWYCNQTKIHAGSLSGFALF